MMKNKYFSLHLVILFLSTCLAINAYSQDYDSLIIFTNKGCSNCIYTKKTLHENGIDFKEYSLEKNDNFQI